MNKVLIIANCASGLYDFREDLIRRLGTLNQKVYTSVPADEYVEELTSLGCKIIDTPVDRRGVNPVKDIKLLLRYFKIINQVKPDFVITYTIKPSVYAGLICRLKKIPYAVNITGLGTTFQNDGILKKLVTAMYKVSSKNAKVVFFENIENLEIFVNLGIVKKENTKLLNGAGVNLDKFSYRTYPENTKTVRFLFMGRIMAEKGVNELFEAMQRLYKNGYNFELDVLGNYEEDYENIINKYENDGWLKYHGYQNDVKPFIEKAHCFVLPSWHEGMANTNLECAAMGRPLITSNIHGCLEAVVENKSGYLCERKNANSLYDCLKKFIELPYDQKVEMGKQSRIHMEEVFDKNKVVDETIKELFGE